LSKITSIATATPEHKHSQETLFEFADKVFCNNETDSRKLRFLYRQSGIQYRHSVLPDFGNVDSERLMFPRTDDLEPFPTLEHRMRIFEQSAVVLSVKAIRDCIANVIEPPNITHLITVSCTGMSAPGLDLEIMEAMELSPNLHRTSVNFMGCYAAIHGLKMADAICTQQPTANVVVVCTELCTLHFQKEISADNMMSSLLFADGTGAMLIQNNQHKGFSLNHFFSEVAFKGKKDMSWQLSATGFLMTLTGYVPELLKADFNTLVQKALKAYGFNTNNIDYWCIHPGGKKILQAISHSISLEMSSLQASYDVLKQYGNMSSASIVFVLKEIWEHIKISKKEKAQVFGAAFGPGLTMETFLATYE